MTRRPNSKAGLVLLGDVLKLLRQRRRTVHSVIIHPDGAIEVRLAPPSESEAEEALLHAELAAFRKLHGYE